LVNLSYGGQYQEDKTESHENITHRRQFKIQKFKIQIPKSTEMLCLFGAFPFLCYFLRVCRHLCRFCIWIYYMITHRVSKCWFSEPLILTPPTTNCRELSLLYSKHKLEKGLEGKLYSINKISFVHLLCTQRHCTETYSCI
jgi:hypothetical protein